jgi:glycosyltransferase involved in cell wall biosynthesis
MRIGFVIYGSLDTLSGGYLYDRKLVEYLRSCGDRVEIISIPWRNYAAHLIDNLTFRLPHTSITHVREQVSPRRHGDGGGRQTFDILIQDELNHPSLVLANQGKHPYPILSLVHHLRCSELRPKWQNDFYRWIEKKYLQSVDGFIFNSRTTERVVNNLIEESKPGVIAYPPTDRFDDPISEEEIEQRAQTQPLRILFLGNVIFRKGLHTLLRAVSLQPSAFRVDVVGSLTSEPAYTKLIKEMIAQKNLSSSAPARAPGTGVFLHGPLDKEPLVEKLRQAHVLAVPSSYEGFGIVYLEGMCFGLPAIGTTAGAASEVIEHGRTGYLINPDDADSLAKHLTSLAEDRGLLTRLSLHARQRYLVQPKWTETAASIREFLRGMTRQY